MHRSNKCMVYISKRLEWGVKARSATSVVKNRPHHVLSPLHIVWWCTHSWFARKIRANISTMAWYCPKFQGLLVHPARQFRFGRATIRTGETYHHLSFQCRRSERGGTDRTSPRATTPSYAFFSIRASLHSPHRSTYFAPPGFCTFSSIHHVIFG